MPRTLFHEQGAVWDGVDPACRGTGSGSPQSRLAKMVSSVAQEAANFAERSQFFIRNSTAWPHIFNRRGKHAPGQPLSPGTHRNARTDFMTAAMVRWFGTPSKTAALVSWLGLRPASNVSGLPRHKEIEIHNIRLIMRERTAIRAVVVYDFRIAKQLSKNETRTYAGSSNQTAKHCSHLLGRDLAGHGLVSFGGTHPFGGDKTLTRGYVLAACEGPGVVS